jgi:cobalt-zinc-cadmium efflux system outer membrane protein
VRLRLSARGTVAGGSNTAGNADFRAPLRFGRIFRSFAPALLVIALAACATYTPAPIDPARTADAFAARRLDTSATREAVQRVAPQAADTWPPREWDRATLLAVALADNGSLAVARAEIEAALAAETTAGEKPNPALGLQSEYARREPDHWLYGISFDFLLRRRGDLDVRLAKLGTSGAHAQLMEHTWSVRHALIGALSDRENAQRRLDVLTQLAAAQDRLVAMQQQRVDAGEDSPSDLNATLGTRIDIDQQQAQARADTVTAEAALAAALGVPPAALDGVAIVWSDWGDPPPYAKDGLQAAREQALLSRTDLAVAINDYAQAETKLERAVARQYPQFEFQPGYYWDHGIAKWPFDVAFTLPLFNRNRGEIAEATAAREVAAQRMLALQARIYGEIEAGARAEDVARENVDAAERRDETMRQQVKHADVALGLGAGDRMQHTSVEILALRATLEIVQAQAQQQTARNALEDALHAPLSGPELELAKPPPSVDSGADR